MEVRLEISIPKICEEDFGVYGNVSIVPYDKGPVRWYSINWNGDAFLYPTRPVWDEDMDDYVCRDKDCVHLGNVNNNNRLYLGGSVNKGGLIPVRIIKRRRRRLATTS